MREVTIGGTRIWDDRPCYLGADIRHKHRGSVQKARELIHSAKHCGVDAVKFQKRENRVLFARAFYDSPYDNENSFGPTYGAHREALELGGDEWAELKSCAHDLGVAF